MGVLGRSVTRGGGSLIPGQTEDPALIGKELWRGGQDRDPGQSLRASQREIGLHGERETDRMMSDGGQGHFVSTQVDDRC